MLQPPLLSKVDEMCVVSILQLIGQTCYYGSTRPPECQLSSLVEVGSLTIYP